MPASGANSWLISNKKALEIAWEYNESEEIVGMFRGEDKFHLIVKKIIDSLLVVK